MKAMPAPQFGLDPFDAVAGAGVDYRLNLAFDLAVFGGKSFLGALAVLAGVFGNAEQLAGAVERDDSVFG
jgi:hypothetical protein